MTDPSAVALIPARGGSKRVPGKNIRALGGHPLIGYTIAAAHASGLFASVLVSTDSEEVADIARYYGAEIPFMRPAALAADLSPDIEWVQYTIGELARSGRNFDCFSLLRPTSPFRRAATIRRAWGRFLLNRDADSLRAVELCRQHPGKMWTVEGERMQPLLHQEGGGVPWHSRPYQSLPVVHVQNASLEIAWTRTVRETGTIAGHTIVPFLTEEHEGFDVNDPSDWWYAEHLVATGAAALPSISAEPWRVTSTGGA